MFGVVMAIDGEGRKRPDMMSLPYKNNVRSSRQSTMYQRHRRSLILGTLAEFCHEIERLDSARTQGVLERAGSWSLDQCCQQLGWWIEFSIDGFPFKYPWHFRLIGRIV